MNTAISTALAERLAWLWYPLVIVSALVAHVLMLDAGIDITYSTYVPVLSAAIAITLLEVYFPYRRAWHPDQSDIINDATFMIVVQVVLPQFLVFLVALVLVQETPLALWPSRLPVFVQFVLMILIADFLRYWLHVACHNFLPLWQLHAVHHSPQKLYWLNVGRFHPLEKALQFLFDSLPFIILGIEENVLAMYFVFYAANGYFQHSNVHVRMGILNYLISSAELHRWHHSIHIHESNRNYGNNIIIWDLLFGTYFFPAGKQVGVLGLKNRRYPATFIDQMKTPFIMRLESINLPLVSIREIGINALLRLRFEYLFLTRRAYIINATRNPRHYQEQLLRRIITRNIQSGYGLDHGFAGIKDYAGFCRQCPVTTYDDLAPLIDTEDIEKCRLTVERPVFFQVTSGTSGKPKYLPVTAAGMQALNEIQKLVALARYLDNPGTFAGKMFAVVSPAVEGYTGSGLPYGSASGLTYQNMPRLSRAKYVVPYEVFGLTDYDLKYRLIALFALAESRVTIIATANPSTMVRIIEVINAETDRLLNMLESGRIESHNGPPLPQAITSAFNPDPERAGQLRHISAVKRMLTYRDLWPNLQTLVTWTGGSCGIVLSALKKYLPPDIRISEMGYLASEVHGTVTLRYQLGIPTFLSNFFEFIPVEDWEAGVRDALLLDQLQPGRRYYVIVTTVNGLYRYFMNDIVEVTDFLNRTPALRFIQKGRGVTSITGEKLYEGQVLAAVDKLQTEHNVSVMFHQWLADEEQSRYEVYIELADGAGVKADNFSRTLEQSLSGLNLEYQAKRGSGRLKPLQLHLLRKGTGEAFKQAALGGRQREGQFKWLTLCYKKDATFPFERYVI